MLEIKQLKELSEKVLNDHQPMMSLYQTLADNFYPERSDFTNVRNVGTELADSLVESYPVLVRRDLGDSLSAMLRDGEWFEVGIDGEPDQMGAMWLEWATKRLRELIDTRTSGFTKATKEGDHDFVTFGDCVISVEVNKKADGLLFRCWHLRDCSWFDDESGQVGGVVRKWKPTYADMIKYFGKDNVDEKVAKAQGKDRMKEGDVRHMVIPSDMYEDEEMARQYPYVSIFIDVKHEKILETKGMNHKMYVVPRFKTIPGSPFGYSPATVCGLPDARSMQQMQFTLLEAAERYTRPPIIATQKAVRSDVDLSADGITWVDQEYDEKLGAALRPLAQDRGGFPVGLEMKTQIAETLKSAFYTNKLSLPDVSREMTAYEVSERMKQYRRENLPLFAPIESEYNGQLCELAFDIAMSNGFLGSPHDIPESLSNREVVFKFQSPLSESEEEKKATQFQQVVSMAAQARDIDPNSTGNVNMDEALRDAMDGTGAPESWKQLPEIVQQQREAVAMAQAAEKANEMGLLDQAEGQ